jgi:hypothetical protein
LADDPTREWALQVAHLIIGGLLDAKIVASNDNNRAVAVTCEKIAIRLAMGDYPPAPSTLSAEGLATIEQRCAASTPGPWTSFVEGRDHLSGSDFIRTASEDIYLTGATVADQDFIACAKQDVPRLIAEVRALRTALGSER